MAKVSLFGRVAIPARAILQAGVAIGLGDLIDALTFFGLIRGASPTRIGQSVAAGLLGRQSFDGGGATALLGLLLHFCVGISIATVFVLLARRIPAMTRNPVVSGLLFGVVAFVVMNWVVVPLSAVPARTAPQPLSVLLNGVIGHALLVGLPCALVVRRAASRWAASAPAEAADGAKAAVARA